MTFSDTDGQKICRSMARIKHGPIKRGTNEMRKMPEKKRLGKKYRQSRFEPMASDYEFRSLATTRQYI